MPFNKTNKNRPLKYYTLNSKKNAVELVERQTESQSSLTDSHFNAQQKIHSPPTESSHPIINQPGTANKQLSVNFESPLNWAERPIDAPDNCSPDISCLLNVDHLLLKPENKPYSGKTDYEVAQVYKIYNFKGEILFLALEESNVCCRQFRGVDRPFVLHLVDFNNKEVMTLHRPCQCFSNSLCLPEYIRVECPPGTVLGNFKEKFSLFHDVFEPQLNPVYGHSNIRFEKLIIQCLWEQVQLKVVNTETREVCGYARRPWAGRGNKWFHNDVEIMGISFPKSTDVNTKALLIAACFLLDLTYY